MRKALTDDDLLAAYRQLTAEEQRRFDRRHGTLVQDRFCRCHTARRQRLDQRNCLLHSLITSKNLPTATLENWRRIAEQLKLADASLAVRGKRDLWDLGHVRFVSPRYLRRSYFQWLKNSVPAQGTAA